MSDGNGDGKDDGDSDGNGDDDGDDWQNLGVSPTTFPRDKLLVST